MVEVLCVIAVATTLAAITYPVFVQIRRSSHKSTCIANLHQQGLAIGIYRIQCEGSDSGTPAQMGLPPYALVSSLVEGHLRCQGTTENASAPGYHFTWPDPGTSDSTEKFWSKFVSRYGTSTVLIFDPNHQPSAGPRSEQWGMWSVLGVRLDTSVEQKTHRGYPHTLWWWQ